MNAGTRVVGVLFIYLLHLASFALPWQGAIGADYKIGVYYYPGWKSYITGGTVTDPWDPIRSYSDRKPLLGWYPEGKQQIIDQQLRWMRNYNIRYVVFSQLFDKDGEVRTIHIMDAYLRSPFSGEVQFAVQWANHWSDDILMPNSQQQFEKSIKFLLKNYFNRPNYVKIDGKPLLFIFSKKFLDDAAKSFNTSASQLIARANQLAKEDGLPGIYFIAGGVTGSNVLDSVKSDKYDAVSAYNYHAAPESAGQRLSHSYAELDQGYRETWQEIVQDTNLKYILPMTAGWDKRPWGGTTEDRLHDNSFSTPVTFRHHLEAAKVFIDQHKEQTRGFGVLCCWNEFGEGSFIEPTVSQRMKYLQAIKSVFQ